jgi:hypothetical protein
MSGGTPRPDEKMNAHFYRLSLTLTVQEPHVTGKPGNKEEKESVVCQMAMSMPMVMLWKKQKS